MATGDKLVTFDMAKELHDKVDGDLGDLKSAFAQQRRSGISYLRGGYYASGLKAEASNDAVSTGMIVGGAVVTVTEGIVYRILLYNNGQYIGKINSSYGVDTVGGSWWSFSGTVDMYKLLAEKFADAFALVILANGSDAPTESTYQAWGDAHCVMYTGTMYGIGDIRNRFDDLSGKAYLKKGILTNADSVDALATVGFYRVYGSSIPTGWPTTGGGNLLVARGDFAGTVSTGICQIVWANNQTFVRFSGEGAWTNWQTYYSEGSSPDVASLKTNAYQKKSQLTESDDIDTIINHGFYRAYGNHLPQNWPIPSGGGNLIVMRGDNGNDSFGVCQAVYGDNKILIRFGSNGTNWNDWQTYYSDGNSPTVTALANNAYVIKNRITATTDINALNDQGSYRVSLDSTDTWAPVNWPLSGGGNLLVIKANLNSADTFGNCQIVYGANEIRVRFGAGGTGWTEWNIYRMSGTGSDIVALNNEEETTLKLRQLSTSRDLSTTLTVQPVTILHFSDLHQNATALSRIVDFKTHYSSFINDVIHTGDTINTTEGTNTFANVSGAGSILNVIGNHDTWDGGNNWEALTEAETNDRFISPFSSNWGNVSIPSGKCYYSKDYYDSTDQKNVVLIVLDVMHINQGQLTWFINTLNQAKSNGRHVIIANHTIMGKLEDMTYLDSGFDNPMYPRSNTPDYPFPMYIPSAYVDAVDAFVSGGGVVVAWIAGHMHNDTLATYHNILNIAVTTAGDYSGVGRTTDMRVVGTKSQDAFNIYGINTLYGHLYGMRVGLDYNAVMKKIDTFCWDYINHRMIYTS
jgi:hypothetical protein